MFILNGKRFNLNSALAGTFTDVNGIQHPGTLLLDPVFREENGITEIPDPAIGDPLTQFTQEIDVAPYVIITDKPLHVIVDAKNAAIKDQIAVLETQQGRAIRDAILHNDKTWLTSIDTQIAALRGELLTVHVGTQTVNGVTSIVETAVPATTA